MTINLIACMALLQVKHYIVDFPLQSQSHLVDKGLYGNLNGITHSLYHGLGTFLCLVVLAPTGTWLLLSALGLLDAVVHYHVDWIKTRFGNKDIREKTFWNQLGQDQLAHQLTYLLVLTLLTYMGK